MREPWHYQVACYKREAEGTRADGCEELAVALEELALGVEEDARAAANKSPPVPRQENKMREYWRAACYEARAAALEARTAAKKAH